MTSSWTKETFPEDAAWVIHTHMSGEQGAREQRITRAQERHPGSVNNEEPES